MAKPIFVVKLPADSTIPEVARRFSDYINSILKEDYFVLIFLCGVKELTFECFNADNLPPINEEKLKEICKTTTAKD